MLALCRVSAESSIFRCQPDMQVLLTQVDGARDAPLSLAQLARISQFVVTGSGYVEGILS